jgi:hypothetical protein
MNGDPPPPAGKREIERRRKDKSMKRGGSLMLESLRFLLLGEYIRQHQQVTDTASMLLERSE